MWNLFLKIFSAIHPPDACDEKLQQAWRATVGWTLTFLILFAIYITLSYAAGVPRLVPEVVFASDVKTKIEENALATVTQVAIVAAEVSTIKEDVKDLKSSLNKSLAQSKAAEIRVKTLKRCTVTNSSERDSFNREIDQLQFEYKVLIGERYDTPRCSEL